MNIHRISVEVYITYLRKFKKVDICEDCTVHRHAKINGRNPKGVHIGDRARIAARAIILLTIIMEEEIWWILILANKVL